MVDDPDYALIQRCSSKDPLEYEAAFLEIYRKYGEKVYNIAFRILGNAEDAHDVTQDAFITLFKKIEEFRKDSKFFTWFYRIVVNLSIDRRRKQITDRSLTEGESRELISNFPDHEGDHIDRLVEKEFLEKRVQDSLMKLSPNLRTVIVLRYIEGLAYADIADTLQCSLGTIKSRINRAHRLLEDLLKPEADRFEVTEE